MSDHRCIRCKQSKYGMHTIVPCKCTYTSTYDGRTHRVYIQSVSETWGRGREGRSDRNKSCLLSRGNVDSSVFRVATTTRKALKDSWCLNVGREKGRAARAMREGSAYIEKKEWERIKMYELSGSCRLINVSKLCVCTRLNREHRGWHPTIAATRNSPSSLCLYLSLFRSSFSFYALTSERVYRVFRVKEFAESFSSRILPVFIYAILC